MDPWSLILLLGSAVVPFIIFASVLLLVSIRMRARRVRWIWIGCFYVLAVVLFLYGPTWTDRALNADVYLRKTGRVIDADTGEGIPGAFVVADANFIESVLKTGTLSEYRLILRTDSKGNYAIPSTWQYAISPRFYWMTFFFESSKHTWTVLALKPGYIEDADEQNLVPPTADVDYRPRVSRQRVSSWSGLSVNVQPIKLRKHNLSSAQAIVYYRGIALYGVGDSPEADYEMNRAISAYIASTFCSETSANPLTPKAAIDEISIFLRDSGERDTTSMSSAEALFRHKLRELEPSGFRNDD